MHTENKSKESSDSKYRCEDCNEGVRTKSDLLIHIKAYHAKTKHKCPICNKMYSHSWGLTRHMISHGAHCKICLAEFESEEKMNEHFKLHQGETEYTCHICSKAFTLPRQLRFHIRVRISKKKTPINFEFLFLGL